MNNCWLSPNGDVYYCTNHAREAWRLIEKLGLKDAFYQRAEKTNSFCVERFLESQGWLKYSSHKRPPGWCIVLDTRLTQAQRDKIYEITGEFFEDKNLIGPYCVRPYFFIQKNLNKCGEF